MSFATNLAWRLIQDERTGYTTEYGDSAEGVRVSYTWTVGTKEPKAALIALAIARLTEGTKEPVTARQIQDMGFSAATVRKGLPFLSTLPAGNSGAMLCYGQRGRSRAYYLGAV